MSLLTVTNLSKLFGAVDLFRDVSFAIPVGARLALIGPNGCGKTTLLRILLGVEAPSAGVVRRAKGLRIGYLPQQAEMFGRPVARRIYLSRLCGGTNVRARARRTPLVYSARRGSGLQPDPASGSGPTTAHGVLYRARRAGGLRSITRP